MSKSSNKRTPLLLVTLIALLLVGYKVIFVVPPEVEEVNPASIIRLEGMINQLNSINLTNSAMNDPKLDTLEDINQPLPSLPIGRENPFSSF